MTVLSQPVTGLRGAGPRTVEALEKLGIRTVGDVLFHLPSRYEDRSAIRTVASLRPGEKVLVDVRVDHAEVLQGRRRRLVVQVSDDSGGLTLVFFRFYPTQLKSFQKGTRLQCYGEVRPGLGELQMAHPEYQLLGVDEAPDTDDALRPIYPTVQGLNQATIRRLVASAFQMATADGALADWLPAELMRRERLPSLEAALRRLHWPDKEQEPPDVLSGQDPALRRLVLDELIGHRLSLRKLRALVQRARAAPAMTGHGELQQRFEAALPFVLTAAQRRVHAEIAADLQRPEPMLRLVQGDVGSGKTVIAALAAVRVIECGWQVGLMAPTEILAEQHYQAFREWLEPLGIQVSWLSGRLSAAERRQALTDIAEGRAGMVIGTHALFQEAVLFDRLGLAIIDEQHRFGVHQRLALQEKGQKGELQPHQLVMTATPIPRTLAMTAYADLDVSVIDELPPGRSPVTTVVVSGNCREEVWERVRAACREGRQCYWVCTLIEESELLEAQAAQATFEALAEAMPELTIALVHGRMKAVDKDAVMQRFKAGEINLLVATTVIEVGVNVPNASLMIIENAERLGLAQLHQLRGRVGRGNVKSSCVLMYGGALSEQARSRLAVMRESQDGFEIARKDLEIRGPGELLGTRQTGAMNFRVADLLRDQALLQTVQQTAEWVMQKHPERVESWIARWVGEGERYARV